MHRNVSTIVGLVIVAGVFGALLFEPLIAEPGDSGTLRYGIMMGAVVVAVALGWKRTAGPGLSLALNWSAAATMCFATAVALPTIVDRMGPAAGTERPRAQTAYEPGVVNLSAERNGHFLAQAEVDGTYVEFLVDTGATLVALSRLDAQRIGIDVSALPFDYTVQTANGEARTALVRLDSISIGDITVKNVQASIIDEGLEQSLLGMSFLSRLTSFKVEQDRLILRE